jgi:hypothetical protein
VHHLPTTQGQIVSGGRLNAACAVAKVMTSPPDADSDTIPDACDNCPTHANVDQVDTDLDLTGNACDNCPSTANRDQADGDSDGVGNACDNCPTVSNEGQTDTDADGVGNACDNCPTTYNPTQAYVGNPVVQVLSPNGGETVVINNTVNLTWSATDTCGGVSSVDILLSRNGVNGTYSTIASAIANTGSYSWLVTGPKTTGATAFLKVVARDPAPNVGSDVSNAGFTIVKLVAP